jgi:hypothetical protein
MLAASFGLNRSSSGQYLQNLKMLVDIILLINITGSHSHSLLFFIINTSYSCVICSKVFDKSTVRVLPKFLLIDNFKIVNNFEDIWYKMCYKDFRYFYITYIVTVVILVKL